MLVTFISQCEKNALKRTRRVLDAFANRIGDNVWQTAITAEGLDAVKKLLRKTASKSTAVACHRVRSRQRTELVWMVGNRRKFNEMGVVPVNWTTKEIIMDKLPIETTSILANTNRQPLSQHLFAVGFVAHQLLRRLDIGSEKLTQSAFIAGVLHDIGKIDPQFQQWLAKKLKKGLDVHPDDGLHIDTSVQGFTKFSFEKHPRHNEISWLFALSLLNNNENLNSSQIVQIFHGIYWHHTRPFRREKSAFFDKSEGIHKLFSQSLSGTTFSAFTDEMMAILNAVKTIAENYPDAPKHLFPTWSESFQPIQSLTPEFKLYDDLAEDIAEFVECVAPNAQNNLIRTAVISADRMVSELSSEALAEYLAEGTLAEILNDKMLDDSTLSLGIEGCLQGFEKAYPDSARNLAQSEASDKLAELQSIAEFDERANIAVLQGPAGCGKTKIALEWAQKTGVQKIIWVCPRVQVCLGLLHDLTQSDYLPNRHIEIFTGEHKKIISHGVAPEDAPETAEADYFSGDIVLTTIDQVVKNIISHHKVTAMVDFMQAHVIFDEFHELIPTRAFNLLLAELIEAKKMRGHRANTLLVSATPHDYFVQAVLGLDEGDIVRVDSFSTADYQLNFQTYDETEQTNPLITEAINDDKTTFIISNTAQTAQLGFLHHQQENSVLFHSKYTKMDGAQCFDAVFNSFKRAGDKRYQVLRSGPIVQASLNISCERMVTELTSPENWLQRLGRLDRFNENGAINVYTTVLPESAENGKLSSRTAKFLNTLFSWRSTVAWLNYLQDALEGKDSVKINELYQLYQAFYVDTDCREKVREDLQLALKESVKSIHEKIIDPISVPPKNNRKTDGVVKIAKNSLRGDNRFVQMAVCEVDAQMNLHFPDEYAYDENIDHSSVTVGLTESKHKIEGRTWDGGCDPNHNLVAYMHTKHHNIMSAKFTEEQHKKAQSDKQLIELARSPEAPIYLSYTPADLTSIGGERKRHKHGIYYVRTDKQIVGMMSLDKIKQI